MKTVCIATTQMDANLAALRARLCAADELVRKASDKNAELVLLPELFNTGYAYTEEMHERAESEGGTTYQWMKNIARKYSIHVAGSFLVRSNNDIVNRLYLVSPDGESWQYDKNYPWAWERGYFKGGENITIAETAIGRIGFLICWDVGHTGLWKKYHNKVDFLLVCSCPPNTPKPTYTLTNGARFDNKSLGVITQLFSNDTDKVFKQGVSTLARALNVPVVVSTGANCTETVMPCPRVLWLTYCLFKPSLFLHWRYTKKIVAHFDYVDACRIVHQQGHAIKRTQHNDSDAVITAEISWGSRQINTVRRKFPKWIVSPFAYFLVDGYWKVASIGVYRKGKSRIRNNTVRH